MKAISIKQPHASLIFTLCNFLSENPEYVKTVELRTWATSYRGPLLICSSKEYDWTLAADFPCECGALDFEDCSVCGAPRGQALGIVDLIGCRPASVFEDQAASGLDGWAIEKFFRRAEAKGKSVFAWELRVVKKFKHGERFPVRGSLGLFNVEIKEAAAA